MLKTGKKIQEGLCLILTILFITGIAQATDVIEDFQNINANTNIAPTAQASSNGLVTIPGLTYTWGGYNNAASGSTNVQIRARVSGYMTGDGVIQFRSASHAGGSYILSRFARSVNLTELSCTRSRGSSKVRFLVRDATAPNNWYASRDMDPGSYIPNNLAWFEVLSGSTELNTNVFVPLTFEVIPVMWPGLTIDAGGLYIDTANGTTGEYDLIQFLGTVTNQPPVVDAGPDLQTPLSTGASVLINATVTDDNLPDPALLTINWSVLTGPPDSNVIFSDNTAEDPTVTFDTVGDYTLQLLADDSQLQSSDTLLVKVTPFPVEEVQLIPIDDTYVEDNKPQYNYGSDTKLRLNSSQSRRCYLKFDPGPIRGNIFSAILKLYSHNLSDQITAYALTYGPNGEWFEGTGTQAAPDTNTPNILRSSNDDLIWGRLLDSISPLADNTWYEFDVKDLVIESDDKINLALKGSGPQTNWGLESEESGHDPTLIIQYYTTQAYSEYPTDGSTELHPEVVLSWLPGQGAAENYLYLGTDANSLALVDIITVTDPNLYLSHDPNGTGRLILNQEYFWRIDADNNSIGELWSFTINSYDPDKPRLVNPIDMSFDVPIPAELTWQDGFKAENHNIYFSDNQTDVMNLDPAIRLSDVNSPITFDALTPGTTYYWRAEATAAADGPWPGEQIWSFTTASCVTIDNFEDANVWPGDGAITSADVNIVEDSAVSMRIVYDNNSPAVSQTSLDFNPAGDFSALSNYRLIHIRFKGRSQNVPNHAMYIKLSDGINTDTVFHDDPNALVVDIWQPWDNWYIDLNEFTTVDLNSVTTMTLGFLNISGYQEPGGIINIDDVRICESICIPKFVMGDFIDENCTGDINDLFLLALDFLATEDTVDAEPLTDANLEAWFTFDGASPNDPNILIDSVNNYQLTGANTLNLGEPGKIGYSVAFPADGYLTLQNPGVVFAPVSNELTISIWIKGNDIQPGEDGKFPLSSISPSRVR